MTINPESQNSNCDFDNFVKNSPDEKNCITAMFCYCLYSKWAIFLSNCQNQNKYFTEKVLIWKHDRVDNNNHSGFLKTRDNRTPKSSFDHRLDTHFNMASNVPKEVLDQLTATNGKVITCKAAVAWEPKKPLDITDIQVRIGFCCLDYRILK